MSSTVLTHSFFLSKFSYCHSNFPSFPSHSNFATCFEWLLEGCHRIADVAVAYYPNYAYACSAVKALRRSIAEHACLLKDLTDQGYTARTAHLTPVQIGILLSYWGMPDHVKDMTVKNPYLLVSKKYAK